jgi:inhibitor of KinA sporulation pathway (predicted exonuclease)
MRADRALHLDLELTCWEGPTPGGQTSEIIQIGIVEVDTLKLEITRKAMRYVRPLKSKVSPYCTELTGITQRQVDKQGTNLVEVMNSITNEFGPKNKTCFAWGEDGDCLAQGMDVYGGRHNFNFVNLGQLFTLTMGLKRAVSVEDALKIMGLAFKGRPHDALVDAENTALLHIAMMRRMRTVAIPDVQPSKPCGNCGWCLDCLREERNRPY